jgi:putative transposase
VKGEWPHLERIGDPALLEHELGRVRHEYNSVRLSHGESVVWQHVA